jgi:3'-phosphoadenosine 5'-phosphosulfate sulfotransferase (PAPS reductase)/FAD synthetase
MQTGRIPDGPLLVAYSGGKDSLAVMDLCVRAGRQVEAFLMYFVPGMDYTQHWVDYAARRWSVKVRLYQHFTISYFIRRGVFRSAPAPSFPRIKVEDVIAKAREDSGIEWAGFGYKLIDSLQRRGWWKRHAETGCDAGTKRFAPLLHWNNTHVKAYLSRRGIPCPGIDGKRSTGISLTPDCLEWLRTEWPADYRRVLEVFPFAESQADRAGGLRERKQRDRAERQASQRAARLAKRDQSGTVQPAGD